MSSIFIVEMCGIHVEIFHNSVNGIDKCVFKLFMACSSLFLRSSFASCLPLSRDKDSVFCEIGVKRTCLFFAPGAGYRVGDGVVFVQG